MSVVGWAVRQKISDYNIISPPNSPDLSVIKHLWDMLDIYFQSMKAPHDNLQDLNDYLNLFCWGMCSDGTLMDVI